jgi:arabinonate dehydratase
MSSPSQITIRLHPDDNIVVARADLLPGTPVPAEGIAARSRIPSGHKVATRRIAKGEPVRRYGQIIGFASDDIEPGLHVHTHNCEIRDFQRDYAYGTLVAPTQYVNAPATFAGYRRDDGRVATRNYIGVLTSVNCSATVARYIAEAFRTNPFSGDGLLADHPTVDGVVALTHKTGCGMAGEGEGMDLLRRVIAGYARHPNFAAVLVVGLGCEANQIGGIMRAHDLTETGRFHAMTIQDTGGAAKTVKEGVARIKELLPDIARARREAVPASHITIGLQCGGSDGYSGISANPALGAASDLVVRHGGTSIS